MNREEILKKLQSGELGVEEANKLLEEAEQQKRSALFCKVSPKGALSVYGLQRMPVTLYVDQWERLLDFGEEIRRFVKQNEQDLKRRKDTA